MACNCKQRIYGAPAPPKPSNCFCVNDVLVGCNDGPAPCGDTLVINLTEYNDVSASPCEVEYILLDWDKEAFADVTLTIDGMLNITTSNVFKKSEEFCISYKVNSPCSILSDIAEVRVCMKDLCVDANCSGCETCNQCTGVCECDVEVEVTGEGGASNPIIIPEPPTQPSVNVDPQDDGVIVIGPKDNDLDIIIQ